MRHTNVLMASASVTALFFGASLESAFAQEDEREVQNVNGDEASAGRDVIVVTARRRAETLETVPVSVTYLAGDELNERSINRTEDLDMKVPGLAVQDGAYGQTTPFVGIRGQIQKSSFLPVDNSVGVYLNDVVLSRLQGLNSALYDLESVQVLKGPQGTLFGRNTPGGAVLYKTRAPSEEFEGYVIGTAGNYDLLGLEGAINLPIADWLQIRFAGLKQTRDGYIKNLNTGSRLRDEDSQAWRVSVRFKPSETVLNNLVIDKTKDTPLGSALRLAFAYDTSAGDLVRPVLNQLEADDFWTVSVDDPVTDVNTFTVTNNTEIDLSDNVTFKNIFGYRSVESFNETDLDGTPFLIFTVREIQDVEQFSEEIQLSGEFGDALQWIVGGYYLNIDGSDRQTSIAQEILSFTRPSIGFVEKESWAGYGQVTYDLPFLQGVSVTAGGRYTWEDRAMTVMNFSDTAGTCRITVSNTSSDVLDPCVLSRERSFSDPNYTFSIDWLAIDSGDVIDSLLLYATTRRGFRAGGFDLTGTRPASFEGFDSETVTDYEIGAKLAWSGRNSQGLFTIAAFTADYKDIQRNVPTITIENGTTVFTSRTSNAAEATIEGLEAELFWSPVPALDLEGFVGYVSPQFDDFVTVTGTDLSGNRFSSIPEVTAGGGVTLRLPSPDYLGDVSLRGDVYYQSKSYTQDSNFDSATGEFKEAQLLPEFTTVNLRLDVRDVFAVEGASVAFFARNVFNDEHFIAGTDLTAFFGTGAKLPGNPRTYGVEVSYDF